MPQLAERSITIQEVRSSNPVVGKTDTEHFLLVNVEKTKRKKKGAGNGPFFGAILYWLAVSKYNSLFNKMLFLLLFLYFNFSLFNASTLTVFLKITHLSL